MITNTAARNRQERISRTRSLYKMKFQWSEYCVYCGDFACVLDHVLPVSIASGMDFSSSIVYKKIRPMLYLVPSCKECNAIASNKYEFSSIKTKRIFIQKLLARRYKKLLKTPDWDAHDMRGIRGNLRKKLKSDLKKLEYIKKRISWPHSKNFVVKI